MKHLGSLVPRPRGGGSRHSLVSVDLERASRLLSNIPTLFSLCPRKATPTHCIDNCQSCHAIFLQMLSRHRLEIGGKHVEPAHLKIMMDCAQICRVSADIIQRGSALLGNICAICAEVCQRCAVFCDEVGDMHDCVKACRACADSCAKMGQMAS